ncbi:hypothetical protein C8R46DRAFT_1005579 [Mycena filopes]|nr:hypothetical protein C8R46DRAFT_1005579 [Mycena filopes]
MNIHRLPNEFLLQIFPYLPLKALISARGVDTFWRALVLLADLDPVRRSLLDLYLRTIASPAYMRTRPWVLQNLHPFDREAYSDALLDQHNYVPREFRLWILEWPEKAVVGCAWPGLPDAHCGGQADHIECISGTNLLGRIPPVVHIVQITQPAGDGDEADLVNEDVPGLVTWQLTDESWVWLILDERPSLRGRVYDLRGDEYDKDEEDPPENPEFRCIHSTWIEWQYDVLRDVERMAQFEAEHPEYTQSTPRQPHNYKLGGVPVTEDQWVMSQYDSPDRIWSEAHATGRLSNPSTLDGN